MERFISAADTTVDLLYLVVNEGAAKHEGSRQAVIVLLWKGHCHVPFIG